MTPVEVRRADGPIILGLPHTGTYVPRDIAAQLNATGRLLADTDWHIERLYDGLLDEVTTVRARFHRYVIDANRDPEGRSLYPGQNTTGLVPLIDFDGAPIWDQPPSPAQIEDRLRRFHAPYHAALRAEIDRVTALHGVAILYDCHSIRAEIPYLFDGLLPDFNIGTNDGKSCAPQVQQCVERLCAAAAPTYSHITNGRFKGGWTTRHYGQPEAGIHAIQMELTQSRYLRAQAPPWAYDPTKAAPLRAHLALILAAINALAPKLKGAT